MNDAQCYQIIGIGLGMGWDLPRQERLIADGDYAATVPLIVPRKELSTIEDRGWEIEDYALSVSCKYNIL